MANEKQDTLIKPNEASNVVTVDTRKLKPVKQLNNKIERNEGNQKKTETKGNGKKLKQTDKKLEKLKKVHKMK